MGFDYTTAGPPTVPAPSSPSTCYDYVNDVLYTSTRPNSTQPAIWVVVGASAVQLVESASITQNISLGGSSNVLILATAGGSGITLTWPSAVGVGGQVLKVVMVDTGAGGVSNVAFGGQLISGRSSWNLTNQWQYIQAQSTGSFWVVIANN